MRFLNYLRKRGLALFMALVMCLSLLPATALAEEIESNLNWVGLRESEVYAQLGGDGVNAVATTVQVMKETVRNADGMSLLRVGAGSSYGLSAEFVNELGPGVALWITKDGQVFDQAPTPAKSEVEDQINPPSAPELTPMYLYGVFEEPAHVHEWSDWTVAVSATTEQEGQETRTCSCGETETRAIPRLELQKPIIPEEVQAFVAEAAKLPEVTAENAADVLELLYGETLSNGWAMVDNNPEEPWAALPEVQAAYEKYKEVFAAAEAMLKLQSETYADTEYEIKGDSDNSGWWYHNGIAHLNNWLNSNKGNGTLTVKVSGDTSLNGTLIIPADANVVVESAGGLLRRSNEDTGKNSPMFQVNGTLTLRNITVRGCYDSGQSGNQRSSRSIVEVNSGGTLVLESNSHLQENQFPGNDGKGGAVYVRSNGNFTMKSGSKIEQCYANEGGAVYLENSATFIAEQGASMSEIWSGNNNSRWIYVSENAIFTNSASIDGVYKENSHLPPEFVNEWLVITVVNDNGNFTGIPSEPNTVSGYRWDHLVKNGNGGYSIVTTGNQWDNIFTKQPDEVVRTEILESPEYIRSTNTADHAWGVADSTGKKTKAWLKLDESFWENFLTVLAEQNRYKVYGEKNVILNAGNQNLYKVIPYVVKFQDNSNEWDGWHIDCAVIPKEALQVTYNLNLPDGVTTNSAGFGLPPTVVSAHGAEEVKASPVGQLTFNGSDVTPTTVSNPTQIPASFQNQEVRLLFKGWSTTPTGIGGTLYQPGSSATFKETTTLYAQWDQTPPYKITYTGLEESDFATTNPNPTTYSIVTPTFTLQNPAKEGYEFLGWTGTGLDGATQQVTIPVGSQGDREYMATWVSSTVSYTVTAHYMSAEKGTDGNYKEVGHKVLSSTDAPANYGSITLGELVLDEYKTGENLKFTEEGGTEKSYIFDSAATTYRLDSEVADATDKLIAPAQIDLYYDVDNWSEKPNEGEDPENTPDEVPDKYQVLVKFKVAAKNEIVTGTGSITATIAEDDKTELKSKVYTLKDGEKNVTTGTITVTAAAKAQTGSAFASWTSDKGYTQKATEGQTNVVALDNSLNATGGSTYTYTATFLKDEQGGTSGGDNIPDDYQVKVTYKATTGGKVTVGNKTASPAKDETAEQPIVMYLPVVGEDGITLVETGKVTFPMAAATADDTYKFTKWTKKVDDGNAEDGLITGVQTNVAAETEYEFTANFAKDTFTVKFAWEVNGGVLPENTSAPADNQTVAAGRTASDPSKTGGWNVPDGYAFLGWYTKDAEGNLSTAKYNFTTPVNNDLTLYAYLDFLPQISEVTKDAKDAKGNNIDAVHTNDTIYYTVTIKPDTSKGKMASFTVEDTVNDGVKDTANTRTLVFNSEAGDGKIKATVKMNGGVVDGTWENNTFTPTPKDGKAVILDSEVTLTYELPVSVFKGWAKIVNTITVTPKSANGKDGGEETGKEEVDYTKQITGVTKVLDEQVGGKPQLPKTIEATDTEVTLYYTITVTGDEGAKFTISETDGATITDPSGWAADKEYTMGTSGTMTFKATKTFTVAAGKIEADVSNTVKVTKGEGTEIPEGVDPNPTAKTYKVEYVVTGDIPGEATPATEPKVLKTVLYEATFDKDGKATPVDVTVDAALTEDGYEFSGWKKDNTVVTGALKITDNVTLTGTWTKLQPKIDKPDKKVTAINGETPYAVFGGTTYKTVTEGDKITYEVKITPKENEGLVKSFEIVDTVSSTKLIFNGNPSDGEVLATDVSVTVGTAKNPGEWKSGTIYTLTTATAQPITVTYTYTVGEISDTMTAISNTATVTVWNGEADDKPKNPGNDQTGSDTEEVPVARPAVTIAKKVTKDGKDVGLYSSIGDELTYTITVSNSGNVELKDLKIEDKFNGTKGENGTDIRATASYMVGTESVKGSFANDTFTIDSLAVGGTATITYTYTVDKKDAGSKLTNTAAVSENDPNKTKDENPEDPKNPHTTETTVKHRITKIEKALVTEAEAKTAGIETNGIKFPMQNGEAYEVTVAAGESVTLLYKITVTGTVGAEYVVTDTGAKHLDGTDASTISGTIGKDGPAVIYVTKTFGQGANALTGEGKATNEAGVAAKTPGTDDIPTEEPKNENDKKDSAPDVTVKETYTLTVKVTNGTAKVGEETVTSSIPMQEGSSTTINFAANTGYALFSAFVDGTKNVYTAVKNGSYTFKNVDKDHSITVVYAEDKWSEKPEAGNGPENTPDGIPDAYQAVVKYVAENGGSVKTDYTGNVKVYTIMTAEEIAALKTSLPEDIKSTEFRTAVRKVCKIQAEAVPDIGKNYAFDNWTAVGFAPIGKWNSKLNEDRTLIGGDIYTVTAHFAEDKKGGTTDPEDPDKPAPDGSPDKYQQEVIFEIPDGSGSFSLENVGKVSEVKVFAILTSTTTDENGKLRVDYDEKGTAALNKNVSNPKRPALSVPVNIKRDDKGNFMYGADGTPVYEYVTFTYGDDSAKGYDKYDNSDPEIKRDEGWNNKTCPTKVEKAEAPVVYTYTYPSASQKYTFEYIFLNQKGESVTGVTLPADFPVEEEATTGTEQRLTFKGTADSGNNHYVLTKVEKVRKDDKTWDELADVKTGKDLAYTFTVSGEVNKFRVTYKLDNWGDGGKPDGTPDSQQVLVKYVPSVNVKDNAKVTVMPKTDVVVTLTTIENGKYTGAVELTGTASAEKDSGFAFDYWTSTKDGTPVEGKIWDADLTGKKLESVFGGEAYVYTANFDVDEKGGPTDPSKPDEKGDGIPDEYQAFVTFQSADGKTGTVNGVESFTRTYDLRIEQTVEGKKVYATKADSEELELKTEIEIGKDFKPDSDEAAVEAVSTSGYAFDKWTLDSKDYQITTINAETGKVDEAMAVLASEVKVTNVTGNGEYTFEAKFEKDEIGKDGGTNGGDGIPDKYQATVTFASAGGTAILTGSTTTVVTLYKDGKFATAAEGGKGALAEGQIPTVAPRDSSYGNPATWTVGNNTVAAPAVGTEITGDVTYNIEYTLIPTVIPDFPFTPTPTPVNPTPTPTPTPGGTTITDENVPLAGAVGLNDTDHFAYIAGYEDDTVRPTKNITRAEVATIFFRLMTEEFRVANWATENTLKDVQAGDWYNNAVSTCANAGIITGYTDGRFQPQKDITRAEFAVIAARFLGPDADDEGVGDFSDTANHWAAAEIRKAAKAGWITGDGNKFRPNDPITRAEVMVIVNRMLDRTPDAGHMLPDMKTWIDNPEGTWYYEAVQEATNGHDYERDELNVETWTAIQTEKNWKEIEAEWAANDGASASKEGAEPVEADGESK